MHVYSPLMFFDARWRGAGLSDAQMQQGHPAFVFGGSFVLSLVGAAMFATFLGPAPEVGFATQAGFAAGLCVVASSFGINYLFESKSLFALPWSMAATTRLCSSQCTGC